MAGHVTPKVFTELDFYLWRIRYLPNKEWRSEIMVKGSQNTLSVMRMAIQSMIEDFEAYGKSTRKFLCNPPEDIDVVRYAKEHGAEIEWLIWLVLRMQPNAPKDAKYKLRNKAVTIRLDKLAASKFLDILDAQIKQQNQYPHGKQAPGNLFFAPDWLGAK